MAKFIPYTRKDGDWGWKLLSTGNNKSIAIAGEGYKNLDDMEHAINLVKEQAPSASIDWRG